VGQRTSTQSNSQPINSYNETTTTSGNSPSGRSAYYVSPTLILVLYIATVIIAVVGCLANLYVLLAMLLSKNSRASNINVFITHQTILDLTSCLFLFLSLVPRKVNYAGLNPSLGLFVCWFFGAHAITTTAGNASVCGLMIITLERYVKIVHLVAYRNHYRPWMTRLGIVIPWIFGICTGFIPILATSKVVRGTCIKNRYYTNEEIREAWGIAKFLLLYVGPLFVFILGYWKILMVIRRQRKQVGQGQTSGTSGVATAAQQKGRRTETNIIKTVVLVSVSFALCFVCMRTYSILTRFRVAPGIGWLYLLFSVFSYSNRCLNPFIYATQYEVVRRWWKVIVYRVVRNQHVEEASMTQSVAPPDGTERQPSNRIHVTTKNL